MGKSTFHRRHPFNLRISHILHWLCDTPCQADMTTLTTIGIDMCYMEQQMQGVYDGNDHEMKAIAEAAEAKDLHIHVLDQDDCDDVYAAYHSYRNQPNALAYRMRNDRYYVMHGADVVIITWGGGLLSQILQFTPCTK